jgi:hypothetical protein
MFLAGAAAVALGALATDAAGVDFAAASGAVPLPSVSIVASTWSEPTVAPSPWMISDSTPDEGAGTSSTTLSVSTSINISSAVTISPTFFFQVINVASSTDSDSSGTLTSTIAIFNSLQSFALCADTPESL